MKPSVQIKMSQESEYLIRSKNICLYDYMNDDRWMAEQDDIAKLRQKVMDAVRYYKSKGKLADEL